MLNSNFSDLRLRVTEYFEFNSTTSVLALIVLASIYYRLSCQLGGPKTPQLQGPRRESFILGNARKAFPSSNISLVYRDWERAYGPVYQVSGFGTTQVVLNDPKALAHLFSKDTTTYIQSPARKSASAKFFGDTLVFIEGETHKRIRRVLSYPLAVSAIRDLTPMILDSAYQVKAIWDSYLESPDKSNHTARIEIVKWFNSFTMDNVGRAILSHDFGNLKGHECPIMFALDSFHAVNPMGRYMKFLLYTSEIIYKLFKIALPNAAKDTPLVEMATHFKILVADFLTKARQAPENSAIHRSVLGVMLKSVDEHSDTCLSLPVVTAQSMLVLAGCETTAVALTWSLIELARRSDMQEILRDELRECLTSGERPTYDQLTKDLKHLDAFISEILRFHPPELQLTRVVAEDDVIPLTAPIRTASGMMIDSLFVSKGTNILVPVGAVNISEALWGPDAGTFNPGRWLNAEGLGKGRREQVPGYRNLLTFAAGARLCPGRDLALLEIKAALAVLISHFSFEFPNGPSTEVNYQFMRPKVAGENGPKVPLLVRRVT